LRFCENQLKISDRRENSVDTLKLHHDTLSKTLKKRCGLFIVQGTRQFGGSDLVTVKYYELLKKSMRGSALNKLAQCCLISCPHDYRMSCQGKS